MKTKVTRTVIFALLIVLLFLGLYGCSALFGKSSDAEVVLKNVDITARMNADGSLTVSERWDATINSDNGIRNFYKEIDLYDGSFPTITSRITGLTVYDNDTGKEYAYIEDPDDPSASGANPYAEYEYYMYGVGSKREIGCYFPKITRGTKSITFGYTITDAVALYEDTAVLYWKIYSEKFTLPIENFSCTITLPDGAAIGENDLVWLHCEVANSFVQRSANSFEYNADDVAAGNYIETRILTDKALFDGEEVAKQNGKAVRESIIKEEQEWFDEWNAEVKEAETVYIVGIVVSALGIIIALGYAIYAQFFFGKYDKSKYPPYVREIDAEGSAAEMGYFFYYYEGGGNGKDNVGKLISATIMDLARREYIKIEPTTNGDDAEYRIFPEQVVEAKMKDLKEHEQAVYALIRRIAENYGGSFTMEEMRKFASDFKGVVRKYLQIFDRAAGAQARDRKYSAPSGRRGIMQSLGYILIMAGVGMYFASAQLLFSAIGAFIAGVSFVYFTPAVGKLTKEGERKHAESKALERYMLEFSNLKEYEIPQLALWEEYMVYATMMGISEKVVKELKATYPELNAPAESAGIPGYAAGYIFGRSYLFTYVMLSSRGIGFDLGKRIGDTMNTVSHTANIVTRGVKGVFGGRGGFGGGRGFGGGGFGGGGGGFGGGGGGAR